MGLLLRSLEPLWRRLGQETMLPALCAEPWLQPPSACSSVVRRAFDRREREKETAREGEKRERKRERERESHRHPCALHRTGMRTVPRTVHRLTVTGQLNLQNCPCCSPQRCNARWAMRASFSRSALRRTVHRRELSRGPQMSSCPAGALSVGR
jgi:hypothetical protein